MGSIDRLLNRRQKGGWLLVIGVALLASPGAAAASPHLAEMSIEELMGIEVTSASKRAQSLGEVPAAVHVISSEDIRRSGATTIPEALRLAPGLTVAQMNSNQWAISSRGFNGFFANKLLVMIDGRSVYTPLFSGTFWDVQDVMLEDVDRIEVVRGPGGSVWGANAVNGVINIITRRASETQGLLVSAGSGSIERGFVSSRYGGTWKNASYRVYFKYFNRRGFDSEAGVGDNDNDAWDQARGGFRLDWDLGEATRLTLQGDGYGGDSNSVLQGPTKATQVLAGGNFLARLEHNFDDGSLLQVQTYYDRTGRDVGTAFNQDRNTFDLEADYELLPWRGNKVQVGIGFRLARDTFEPGLIVIAPKSQTNHVYSAFLQDEIALVEDMLSLTLGTKFEHNSYTKDEYSPSARLLYTPWEGHALWASFARAVRHPARSDRGLTLIRADEDGPITAFQSLNGNPAFVSETLIAYELGYRAQPIEPVTIEFAAYYNSYDDLSSDESLGTTPPLSPCPVTPLLPFCTIETQVFGNKREAKSWGVELATSWAVSRQWKLEGHYTYTRVDIDNSDSTDKNLALEGDTPRHQIRLASLVNLPWNLEFDTTFYWIDKLETERTDGYERLDLRLGWRPIPALEFSLVGQNLTRDSHHEFDDSSVSLRNRVPRSVYGKVTWRY